MIEENYFRIVVGILLYEHDQIYNVFANFDENDI